MSEDPPHVRSPSWPGSRMSTLEFVGGRERKTGSSLSSGAKAESGRLMKPWIPSSWPWAEEPVGSSPMQGLSPRGWSWQAQGYPGLAIQQAAIEATELQPRVSGTSEGNQWGVGWVLEVGEESPGWG